MFMEKKPVNDIKIGVIGGDLRQLVAAKELAEEGFETAAFGFDKYDGDFGGVIRCRTAEDAIRSAAMTVLPLPYSTDGVNINFPLGSGLLSFEKVISSMRRGQLLAGGMLSAEAKEYAVQEGIETVDYYEREELNILNAIPTAEGAIAVAMNELDITLHSSNALVIGYGRIGKTLSGSLCALGAKVTAAARKPSDFAWMRVHNINPIHIDDIPDYVGKADVIFNTVPHTVLDSKALENVRHETPIIDLASKPGGVDFRTAREFDLNVIWALSLPGKAAPVSAGRIIKESLLNILSEKYGDIIKKEGGRRQ